jgi:hypothetical protein
MPQERSTTIRKTASLVGGAIIDMSVEPWSEALARKTESPSMKYTSGIALSTSRTMTTPTRSANCQAARCSIPARTASPSIAPTRSKMMRAQASDSANSPARRSEAT